MPRWLISIISCSVFLILVLIQVLSKSDKPIRSTLSWIACGVLTLALINIFVPFTGISIPVSVLSLCIAAIAGIPGVTTMLILNLII